MEGAKACAAWVEEQEDSGLDAEARDEALSQNPRAAEAAGAKLDGPPVGPVQQ